MGLQKQFLKECGVDLNDFEYAGKFPSINKHGTWGNIPRGEGWKRYSEWLENKLNNNVVLADVSNSEAESEEAVCECGEPLEDDNTVCADCWYELTFPD